MRKAHTISWKPFFMLMLWLAPCGSQKLVPLCTTHSVTQAFSQRHIKLFLRYFLCFACCRMFISSCLTTSNVNEKTSVLKTLKKKATQNPGTIRCPAEWSWEGHAVSHAMPFSTCYRQPTSKNGRIAWPLASAAVALSAESTWLRVHQAVRGATQGISTIWRREHVGISFHELLLKDARHMHYWKHQPNALGVSRHLC